MILSKRTGSWTSNRERQQPPFGPLEPSIPPDVRLPFITRLDIVLSALPEFKSPVLQVNASLSYFSFVPSHFQTARGP